MKRRLATFFPTLFKPAAICVWCEKRIRRGGWLADRQLRHGLCIGCQRALRVMRERI